ncbi:hypothetical protein U1712_001559 [Enterobacter hormaechei subsp. hoffmannii]|uniref:hypothetical protein n=1 Tax=Enterobacter hormaechei TaxID=158836 RepID=UPI001927D483|nr:hypothetical protein [Enterobacter hormaechei]EMA0457703.1 hypothetical protein [Enterobacter hormaechei subsp. hoffmannii]
MTLTKEWLRKTIAELEEERDAVPGVVNEDATMALAAMKLALASLEAEPVAWLLSGGGAKNNVSFDSGNAYADPLREVTPLYTAPPAPVSVPAAMEMDDDFDSAFEHGKAVGWNAYRAAMLQGAEQQNRQQNIPENIPTLRDGLEAIRSLGEIDAGKIQAERDSINSPVIPDGWVMVPVEPTIAILDEFDSIIDYGAEDSKDAWSRLLAAAWIKSLPAAPQREVK